MLGFVLVSIFVTNSAFAEEDKKVHLNIAHSMNALITFQHCKVNSKVKDEKIVILSDIIAKERGKVKNLFDQNRISIDNSDMYKEQAGNWKKEYKQCTEDLIDSKDWPWYKFDLKSMSIGSILTLLALLAI